MKQTQLIIIIVIILIAGISIYLFWPQNVSKPNTQVPATSYTQQIQQIPLDKRYPIGTMTYQGAGVFDRSTMKLAIVPEQPKGVVQFSNQSSETLTLILDTEPNGATIAKTTTVKLNTISPITFTTLGTYAFHEKNHPANKVTIVILQDTTYHPN